MSCVRAMDADRLTSLPAELRNAIWSLALSDGIQDDLPIDLTDPEPPLTRTCRSIRSDTLALYYGRPYGFHTPIAPDDEAARPDKIEAIFEKWELTRARVSEDGTGRLKCVKVVYVSCVESQYGTARRGWPQKSHPLKTSSLEACVLEKLFSVAYGDKHDHIGADVMTTYVSCRTGTPKERFRAKYRYLYHLALKGRREALELEREAVKEEVAER
jgi:hypothetical protein